MFRRFVQPFWDFSLCTGSACQIQGNLNVFTSLIDSIFCTGSVQLIQIPFLRTLFSEVTHCFLNQIYVSFCFTAELEVSIYLEQLHCLRTTLVSSRIRDASYLIQGAQFWLLIVRFTNLKMRILYCDSVMS